MVDEMPRYGNGGWDSDKKKWKIRTKEFRAEMSPKQLERHFQFTEGTIPKNEQGSQKFWLRYLKEVREQNTYTRVHAAHTARLNQLQNEKRIAQAENQDTTEIDEDIRLLGEQSADDKNYLSAKESKWVAGVQAIMGGEVDPFTATILARSVPQIRRQSEKGMLKPEIDEFLKNNKGTHYKLALTTFLEQVGNIPVSKIDTFTYRKWKAFLEENTKGSKVTAENKLGYVKTFLKQVAADHNLIFSFLISKDADKLDLPEPEERNKENEYWTKDEIQKALKALDLPEMQKYRKLARFTLLCGINFGAYPSDLTQQYFLKSKLGENGSYRTGREKNFRQGKQEGRITVYSLWQETLEAYAELPEKYTYRQLLYHFSKLRKFAGITKTQESLRKTGTQKIHELFGEPVSRLYRNEGENDTHYKSYITTTTRPIYEILKEATDKIREEFIL